MPKGFKALCYDPKTAQLSIKQLDYKLVERNGKKYVEPVDVPWGEVGVGDGIASIGWYPLENVACLECGIYGLVLSCCNVQCRCANCGSKYIIALHPAFSAIDSGPVASDESFRQV